MYIFPLSPFLAGCYHFLNSDTHMFPVLITHLFTNLSVKYPARFSHQSKRSELSPSPLSSKQNRSVCFGLRSSCSASFPLQDRVLVQGQMDGSDSTLDARRWATRWAAALWWTSIWHVSGQMHEQERTFSNVIHPSCTECFKYDLFESGRTLRFRWRRGFDWSRAKMAVNGSWRFETEDTAERKRVRERETDGGRTADDRKVLAG